MTLVPSDAHPRLMRALALGVLLLGVGYGAELLGKFAFAPLRIVGALLGFVGLGVFLVAGVFYLGRYLGDTLSTMFG